MVLFRRTVNRLDLRDMQLHGRLYTWSNERSNPTLIKLDRFLASRTGRTSSRSVT
jgi:hypothetical protein